MIKLKNKPNEQNHHYNLLSSSDKQCPCDNKICNAKKGQVVIKELNGNA